MILCQPHGRNYGIRWLSQQPSHFIYRHVIPHLIARLTCHKIPAAELRTYAYPGLSARGNIWSDTAGLVFVFAPPSIKTKQRNWRVILWKGCNRSTGFIASSECYYDQGIMYT
jgi:hypothetical protein